MPDREQRTEDSARPEQSGDRRRELRVRACMTEAERELLQKCLPHLRLVNAGDKPRIPHPVAHVCRANAADFLKRKCREFAPGLPILDVGGGPISYSKHVHACECSQEPYMIVKKRNWRIKWPRSELQNDDTHSNFWSWCECRAEQCTHVAAGTAMFLHSIYYNTPEQVAKILYTVEMRRGYSIQHQFEGQEGRFYGSEAQWSRLPEGIAMNVRGNSHVYVHRDPDWLLDSKGWKLIPGVVFGPLAPNHKLVWTTEPHHDGNTWFTVFDLVTCEQRVEDGHAAQPEKEELEEAVIIDNENLKVVQHKGQYVIREDEKCVRVPLEVVSELRRYAEGQPNNQTTWKTLNGHARRLVKHHKQFNSLDMSRLPTTLTMLVMDEVARDVGKLAKFFTLPRKRLFERYNELVSFEKWLSAYVPFWAELLLVADALAIICAAVLLTICQLSTWASTLVLLMTLMSLVMLNVLLLQFRTEHMVSRLSFIWAALRMLLSIVQTVAGIVRYGFTYSAAYGPVVWILMVYFFLSNKSVYTRTLSGPDLDYYVYIERQLPEYDGPIPEYYRLNGIETRVDPDKFVMSEDAVLEGCTERIEDEPKPGLVCVGPMFTTALPVIFSKSRNNLVVAVKTRALADVRPKVAPGVRERAWKLLSERCDGLLPLRRSLNGTVEPVDYLYKCKTWEEFVERFPPGKRKRLEVFRQRVRDGDYRHAQFCYTGFTKREKQMIITKWEYVLTRPRLIQGLSGIMKVIRGIWFLDYSNSIKYVWHIHHFIWYSSGCTADEQSHWINYHLMRLGVCVALFSDFSKYDMTQGPECMKREHCHLRELGFADDEDGEAYLRAAYRARVYAGDLMWSVTGTRKSGDLNTSSGNTKNTAESLYSYLAGVAKELGVHLPDHMALAALGDDNFCLLTAEFVEKAGGKDKLMAGLKSWMTDLGYVLKVGISDNITAAEYLSLRFYPVNGQYVVGKKPGRCLTKIGAQMYRQGRTNASALEYWKGSLISYIPTSNHVPFLRKYVQVCLDKLEGVKVRHAFEDKFRMQGKIHEASDDTWAAFMDVYGPLATPDNEARFEERLRKTGLNYLHNSPVVDHMFRVDFEL